MNLLLEYERNFDYIKARKWMADNWHISIYLSIAYSQMQNRRAFQINKLLFVWNLLLSIFSTIGSIRAIQEVGYVMKNDGIIASVCHQNNYTVGAGLWAILFALSKVLELFDTIFLVLRKKPVIFLHWYHHVTVLMLCWYAYTQNSSTGKWFTLVNYSIHSFMYAYYAVQSIGLRVPSTLSKAITMAQIFQMVFG
ncbi:unnamed protein product, partial [Oppiella nova]